MDKERIKSVDLFAELPDEQLEKLAGTARSGRPRRATR